MQSNGAELQVPGALQVVARAPERQRGAQLRQQQSIAEPCRAQLLTIRCISDDNSTTKRMRQLMR